jgi:hypothetical protein
MVTVRNILECLHFLPILALVSFKMYISFHSVRMLREELQLLQEQGSYVGEVVKPMDKKKVLVKVCFWYILFPLYICE